MRTRADPQTQRKRILAAARRIFAQEGFARTNTDDVARAAGITRTLVYHYFQSKEEMLNALMFDALERTDRLVADVRTQGGPAPVQIRRLVDGYFDLMDAHPGLAELLVDQAALARGPAMPAYEMRLAHLRGSVLEWAIEVGGPTRPGFDPEQFLLVALGTVFFWFLPTPFGRALGAGSASGQEAREQYKETLCHLLVGWIAETSHQSC
ncbi:MAG: TetR/AcrR family transcriptional regulator [Thermaerobacter sp.]|nr:TetR/AcrR family transcriptional regulator [Thermaerobacter sp.]